MNIDTTYNAIRMADGRWQLQATELFGTYRTYSVGERKDTWFEAAAQVPKAPKANPVDAAFDAELPF